MADVARINDLLVRAGIPHPEETSRCVRAGLLRGAFGFTFTGASTELDKIVATTSCNECTKMVKATLRTLLQQIDYGGMGYEDGGQDAAVKCKKCKWGHYLTACCQGASRWDTGKFHNHCAECPGLGTCVFDYRTRHFPVCSRHYFAGTMGVFDCACKEARKMAVLAQEGERAALAWLYFHPLKEAAERAERAAAGEDEEDEMGAW